MERRKHRMESTVKSHLVQILPSVIRWDPSLSKAGIIVSYIHMTSDLKSAVVGVTFEKGSPEILLKKLKETVPSFRKHLAPLMTSKFVPLLRFVLDEITERKTSMENLLKDITKDLSSKEDNLLQENLKDEF